MATVAVVIPFFTVIALGFLAACTRILPADAVAGLNVFVLYFALPPMLFRLSAATPVSQLLDPTTLTVWLLAAVALIAAALVVALRPGRSWLNASFGGLIAAQPN